MASLSLNHGCSMNGLLSIAIAVSNFPSLSQTFIALQIDELIARGHRVIIVNMGRRREKAFLPQSLQNKYSSLEIINSSYALQTGKWARRLVLCRNILINGITFPLPSLKVLLFFIKTKNGKLFKEIHVDAYQFRTVPETNIVHCQFSTLGARYEKLIRFGFIKKNRKKLAVSIRGYDISVYENEAGTDWLALFRTFDLFLPVCRYFETKLRELGCKKTIAVAGSPVNTAELGELSARKSPHNDKTVKIISVCRLVEKKGLDTAIEAISRVVHIHKQTNFHYTIIGDGPLYKKLEQAIKQNEIVAYVSFAGKKPTTEALKEMAQADILLAPSKKGSDGNSEGIPNAVKEAMALMLTVVSTTHAGIPEIITHGVNGYLVPENDPDSLAEIIVKLIRDRYLRDCVSDRAARQVYDNFSPEKTTDKLLSLYQNILK